MILLECNILMGNLLKCYIEKKFFKLHHLKTILLKWNTVYANIIYIIKSQLTLMRWGYQEARANFVKEIKLKKVQSGLFTKLKSAIKLNSSSLPILEHKMNFQWNIP